MAINARFATGNAFIVYVIQPPNVQADTVQKCHFAAMEKVEDFLVADALVTLYPSNPAE